LVSISASVRGEKVLRVSPVAGLIVAIAIGRVGGLGKREKGKGKREKVYIYQASFL
jgi:hypothetical protein